jgi:molybdate transport system permease protein
MSASDLSAAIVTAQLAALTTVLLIVLGTPLAYWLSFSNSKWRKPISALVSLPLVLPPTVLGFYLLVWMGPHGFIGYLMDSLGLNQLSFSFSGLVLGSMIYSLPFVVQPLQNAFRDIGQKPLDTAATLGLTPWQCFTKVIIPMNRNAFFTAAVLGFAHTVGEFGVVLMIGGNIPDKTRVLSIAIYDHVESSDYSTAGTLAFWLLIFSFFVLFALQFLQKEKDRRS